MLGPGCVWEAQAELLRGLWVLCLAPLRGPWPGGKVPGTQTGVANSQETPVSCLSCWRLAVSSWLDSIRSLSRSSFWASASRLFLLNQPTLRHSTHLPLRKQPEEVMLEIPVPPTSSGYVLKIKTCTLSLFCSWKGTSLARFLFFVTSF